MRRYMIHYTNNNKTHKALVDATSIADAVVKLKAIGVEESQIVSLEPWMSMARFWQGVSQRVRLCITKEGNAVALCERHLILRGSSDSPPIEAVTETPAKCEDCLKAR